MPLFFFCGGGVCPPGKDEAKDKKDAAKPDPKNSHPGRPWGYFHLFPWFKRALFRNIFQRVSRAILDIVPKAHACWETLPTCAL